MNTWNRLLGLTAMFLFATAANATHVQSQGYLTYVGTGGSGQGLYVSIAINPPNTRLDSSCPGPYLFMATTAPQYPEAFALVLAAMTHGSFVTVTYDNVTCSADGNAVLSAVSMSTG